MKCFRSADVSTFVETHHLFSFQEVAKKINLNDDAMKFFALFERVEHDFGAFAHSHRVQYSPYLKF